MNVQKLIAILVAVAINCAMLAWFHAWGAATGANAAVSPAAATRVITLPAVEVHPTAAQLRVLRDERAGQTPEQASVSGDRVDAAMPYYSFAADVDVGGNG